MRMKLSGFVESQSEDLLNIELCAAILLENTSDVHYTSFRLFFRNFIVLTKVNYITDALRHKYKMNVDKCEILTNRCQGMEGSSSSRRQQRTE